MGKPTKGTSRIDFLTSVALVAGMGGYSGSVAAQSTDNVDFSLEEIVVTAQKREATLRDTPIAVTAIGGNTMDMSQLRDIRDLQVLVPSMQIVQRASMSNTSYSIRGISSSTFNFGLEPSVGVFVDGVYRSRNGASINDFLGIERIEVLRGPQSTLFGKNTTAGVVNFITKAPVYETEVEGEVTYGNYNAFVAKGAVNLPLVEDKLAFRLDANTNTRDGVIKNYDGRKLNERDRYGLRGQVLFEPSDRVRLRVIADYNNLDEECCAAPFFSITETDQAALTALGSVVNGVDIASRTTAVNADVRSQLETYGFSAQLDVSFETFDVTSITAYRKYDEYQLFDADFSDLDLSKERSLDQGYETFTQEIRFTSKTDGPVSWMTGLYYFDQNLYTTNRTIVGSDLRSYADAITSSPLFGGSGINFLETALGVPSGTFLAEDQGQLGSNFKQDNQTFAAFGQLDWRPTDKLTITAGLRYTYDKKSMVSDVTINDPFSTLDFVELFAPINQGIVAQGLTQAGYDAATVAALSAQAYTNALDVKNTPTGTAITGITDLLDPSYNYLLAFSALQFSPPTDNVDDDFNDDAFTGNLIISYDYSDEFNLYASYARGYKAGGYALDIAATRVGSFRFDNETADAFELGAKARLMNNRISLDFALFEQTIKDFQANIFVGNAFIPGNAGKIRVRGLEFDGKVQATKDLLLTAGLAWYFDAKYVSFPQGPCPAISQENCTAVQSGTSSVLVQDLAGFRLAEVPKIRGNMTATYVRPVSDNYEMFVRGELFYQSKSILAEDQDARQIQNGYALLSASIGFGAEDGSWQLQFWGKNLTDKVYVVDTFNSTVVNTSLQAYVGDPRTYGLTLRFRY